MDSHTRIGQPRAKSTERSSRIIRQSAGGSDEQTLLDKQLIKLNYLNWFIRVFEEYEQAENLRIVKKFVAANSRRFRSLLEQIQYLRDNVQKADKLFLKSYLQTQIQYYADQNQMLDRQYDELERYRSRKEQSVEERPTLLQLHNLNTTIGQLNKEIEEAQRRQAKIKNVLKTCPFFAQYDLMSIQIQGIQEKNQNLRKIVQTRNIKALRQ